MLSILEPGLLTTVQDLGRLHWYHIGMPPSGALDDFSFRVGNLLVGNPENAAGLEVTYSGPSFEVTSEGLIAVTGADIAFTLNNQPAAQWCAHALHPGDRVSVGGVRRGARAYICLAGGITVSELLGSRSTYMLGRFGGLDGRKLEAGDCLPLGAPPHLTRRDARTYLRSGADTGPAKRTRCARRNGDVQPSCDPGQPEGLSGCELGSLDRS